MSFTGWPEEAFDVLLRLEGDPPQAVRESVRDDRERLVRKPMIELMEAIADADDTYADFSVWRYGKTAWWWQHQTGIVRIEGNVEIGMRFDLDGLQVQGAWWYAPSAQLRRFRAAVADDGSGTAFSKTVRALQDKGYEITGDLMKRVPRAYPPDHPRAWLLRHRSVLAIRPLGCERWLHTPAAVEQVLGVYEELRPFLSWLADHTSLDAAPA